MSELSYNGVELSLVRTNRFTQEAVYDESGSDLLWYKVHLDVDGIISPGGTSWDPDSGVPHPGQYPARTYQAVKQLLMAPRRQLLYSSFGMPILQSPEAGAVIDPAGTGPIPKDCSFRFFGETQCWSLNFKIETTMPACPGGSAKVSPIVSLRYTRSDAIDDQMMTTITTSGYAIFRQDIIYDAGVLVDTFRYLVILPVPVTFRRVAINVRVSPIGNALYFTVTDKEQFFDLGTYDQQAVSFGVVNFLATETTATMRMDSNPIAPAGPTVACGIDVRVWGNKYSVRANLLLFAMRVVIARTGLKGGQGFGDSDPILSSIRVGQVLTDRIVDLHADVIYAPGQQNAAGFGSIQTQRMFQDFVNVPGVLAGNGESPSPPNNRGSWVGYEYSQELRFACEDIVLTKPPTQPAAGGPSIPGANPLGSPRGVGDSGGGSVNVGVFQGDVDGDIPTKWSNAYTTQGMFTDVAVSQRIEFDTGIVQVAVTGFAQANLVSATGVPAYNPPVSQPSPPPAQFLSLSTPVGRRIVDWTAERLGEFPLCPQPLVGDPNCHLLTSTIEPQSPVLAMDGVTLVYRISGRMVYGYEQPVVPGLSNIPLCVLPTINLAVDDPLVNLPAANFVAGIIGTSASSGGSGGGPAGLDT